MWEVCPLSLSRCCGYLNEFWIDSIVWNSCTYSLSAFSHLPQAGSLQLVNGAGVSSRTFATSGCELVTYAGKPFGHGSSITVQFSNFVVKYVFQ